MLARLSLAAVCAVLLTGCADEIPPPDAVEAPAAPTVETAASDDPEPAVLALPHVPAEADRVLVTDWARVALQLGVADVTSGDPAADRASFYRRAAAETAVLSDGVLRGVGDTLVQRFGFGQEEVAWEATVLDEAGAELGFVLGMDESVDPAALQDAVDAGVGPLAGAEVLAEEGVVVQGLDASGGSFADDPAIAALVGDAAISTYLDRGCTEAPSGADTGDLAPLEAWAVGFQGGLATATLGPDRSDAFVRMRLGEDDPAFTAAFSGGVADPADGRLGFRLVDPSAAVELAEQGRLPFTVCAP